MSSIALRSSCCQVMAAYPNLIFARDSAACASNVPCTREAPTNAPAPAKKSLRECLRFILGRAAPLGHRTDCDDEVIRRRGAYVFYSVQVIAGGRTHSACR